MSKDEDKDGDLKIGPFEDLNFRGQWQGLVVRGQGQGRGLENWSSRTRTFLEDNNTDYNTQHNTEFITHLWLDSRIAE